MAKEGKKLELYEILARQKAKGKQSLTMDSRPIRPAGEKGREGKREEPAANPAIIIDENAASDPRSESTPAGLEVRREPEQRPREKKQPVFPRRPAEPEQPTAAPEEKFEPPPPPRPRSPREVVLALDTAFFCFIIILALVGCSYFLGYKRGQEERPASPAGGGDIGDADPERLSLRRLAPAPRSVLRPSDQDYTLIIRTEAADGEMPERLELELAEAVAKGRRDGGGDVQGFIFRTAGAEPRFVLSVGIGKSANDPGLDNLLKIYYKMDGLSLSREPTPYRGCRVAPVRELGAQVY
ncbi:MAG: hypothetical protein LBU23_09405 [Planctomycetota bacterium]|jgi:hypothetical protein|nr:hypothetical protein [Planctomycetota bacterium]